MILSKAFWIGYCLSRGAFWIGYCLLRAATSSDGRERTENIVSTTVFDSRLVFGMGSFNRVSGDSAAALLVDWLSQLG